MRCLIVDDSSDFIDAARGMLERDGIKVVGAASNGAEALNLHATLRPDVTLVDINLGEESGFDVVDQLHRAASLPASSLVLISSHAAEDFADMTAASPAAGFLSKSALTGHAIRELVLNHRD